MIYIMIVVMVTGLTMTTKRSKPGVVGVSLVVEVIAVVMTAGLI